jgi:hypothetical protein
VGSLCSRRSKRVAFWSRRFLKCTHCCPIACASPSAPPSKIRSSWQPYRKSYE